MATKPKTKLYKATDLAGLYIAGRKVPKSGEMELTAEEARHAVLAGVVELVKPDETESDTPRAAPARRAPATAAPADKA